MRLMPQRLIASADAEPALSHEFAREISRQSVSSHHVLNVGSWTGHYERLVQSEANVVGLDVRHEPLRIAYSHCPLVPFVQASALALPFVARSFDVVTMWGVIEHLPAGTEQTVLQEIGRVLRKGGYLWLSTENAHPLSILMDPACFLLGHRHYQTQPLLDTAARAGFEVERLHPAGGIFKLLHVDLMYVCKHLLRKPAPHWPWLDEKVMSEYRNGRGFAQTFLLVRKI